MSLTGVSSIDAEWEQFRKRHEAWLQRAGADRPLYCLPDAMIVRLEKRDRRWRRAIIDETAAAAERELGSLCRQFHAVGFADGRPLEYAPLTPPRPPPSEALMRYAGWWSPARQLNLERAAAKARAMNERLKGVAGWLVTDPDFRAEARGLEARWTTLPAARRPSLPLRRPAPALPSDGSPSVGADDFSAELAAFCDRWDLLGMATWELPLPQGPLVPAPVPAGSPLLPRRGVLLYIPIHYPIPGDDRLLDEILAEQRRLAEDQRIDTSFAGLPHYKAYGQMLEVAHLEATALARYGTPRPPGFVERIEAALATHLKITVNYVQKLRKAISACRRGHRDQIGWLRPRTR